MDRQGLPVGSAGYERYKAGPVAAARVFQARMEVDRGWDREVDSAHVQIKSLHASSVPVRPSARGAARSPFGRRNPGPAQC